MLSETIFIWLAVWQHMPVSECVCVAVGDVSVCTDTWPPDQNNDRRAFQHIMVIMAAHHSQLNCITFAGNECYGACMIYFENSQIETGRLNSTFDEFRLWYVGVCRRSSRSNCWQSPLTSISQFFFAFSVAIVNRCKYKEIISEIGSCHYRLHCTWKSGRKSYSYRDVLFISEIFVVFWCDESSCRSNSKRLENMFGMSVQLK